MDKTFDKILDLNNFQVSIIFLLIFVQIITVLLNIIVIIVMKRSHSRDVMNASKRPNILMTTIAISRIILTTDFAFVFFVIIPIISWVSPNISMIIESLINYIIALSLYVITFTMAVLSIDQYYSLTRVFINPLEKVSTNLLIKIILLSGSVLSFFQIFTRKVYYYDYGTHSIVCSYYENYLHKLSANKSFVIFCNMIMLILQYIIPALIIFVFSFRTIIYFLKKYFQKKETGFELRIALRLFLIFLIFIATNSAFHLFSIKNLIFKFSDEGQDGHDTCSFLSKNWLQYYLFLLSFTFHPIIYFCLNKVFWKMFYIHIVQQWIDSRSKMVGTEVIEI